MLMTQTAAAQVRNVSAVHRTFLIRRDGQPFLIVNATLDRVLAMVAGFRMRSESCWDMELHEA